MKICADCKHRRSGYEKPSRPGDIRMPAQVCGARPLKFYPRDPVTGHQEDPIGTPCSEVNTDGECPDFRRAFTPVHLAAVVVIPTIIFIVISAIIAASQ